VFVTDWNDFGECHDYDGAYRTSGRIYKITYGKPESAGDFDLTKKTDAELINLQSHKNEWYVRHARRILQERAAADALKSDTHERLQNLLRDNWGERGSTRVALRALWALYVTSGLNDQEIARLLDDKSEHLRWWAIKLLADDNEVSGALMQRFTRMARDDKSGLVRLGLASLLQRLGNADRWPIAEALCEHAQDANDQNLPLMIWYGIEPIVPSDSTRAVKLMASTKMSLVRQFIARRLAAGYDVARH
jgi:hypothetical protein